MNYQEAKQALTALINRYNETLRNQRQENISEETIRAWINEFLSVFGWDVQDTHQVMQEKVLRGEARERLNTIHSRHRKPDYTLVNHGIIKSFLDAKDLDVNIFDSCETAFQIRSYGWSAQVPCAFVTNFEQFVIYDTRFVPNVDQTADFGTIKITVDEYIEKFDLLYDHLCKEKIYANRLFEIYDVEPIEGENRLDKRFTSTLSDFRIKLAQAILEDNDTIDNNEMLNYYVQVIIDRIIFIRVCESKGIEEPERLKTFLSSPNGFWNTFKNCCYMEFYEHYDGAMFNRDNTFNSLNIDDNIFSDFINQFYYPYPYKFDVIPIKTIANIYEEFLGKQIIVTENEAKEELKSEYIKTNGAICTPEYIVDIIQANTIKLDSINTVNELFNTKILDPCCGSGVFLVSCYEMLARKLVSILDESDTEQVEFENYSFVSDGHRYLTVEARRDIVINCIYGVDIDGAACEVAKMSLALKIVDGTNPLIWEETGIFGDRILRDISNNICTGNTLVSTDIDIDPTEILDVKPLDIQQEFSSVFENRGGFSYIVSNPPYVETKHFKNANPNVHAYLSRKYESFEGKADLAILFIEKSLSLINNTGKIGFVIQKRWFKTNYGKKIRNIINSSGLLESLVDFKSTSIFKRRMTYVAVIVLSNQNNENVNYYNVLDEPTTIINKIENIGAVGYIEENQPTIVPHYCGFRSWTYDYSDIELIKERLSTEIGTLKNYPNLDIKDGIQALWKRIYHLTNVEINGDVAIGTNLIGERVEIESCLLRKVIYNREFYPFKPIAEDAYCIFPYYGNTTNPILYSTIRASYPLLYDYLESHKQLITFNVRCRNGEYWHTFTREHNHTLYDCPKIIIPMTAKDAIATVVENEGFYMDNSNVWFIKVDNVNFETLIAIACIINSTPFTVMAKAGANPQSDDYYKLNKQFLNPVPFPNEKLVANEDGCVEFLNNCYNSIVELQREYINATPVNKAVIKRTLEQKWSELDIYCYRLYDLTEEEIAKINGIGRTVSRIDLLNGAN